jgi:hypothetical protein
MELAILPMNGDGRWVGPNEPANSTNPPRERGG